MDTESDLILQNKEEILGANTDDFLKWLDYNAGIIIAFKKYCNKNLKNSIIELLKEKHWEDYLEELEDAHRTYRDDERARMSV